MAIPVLKTSQFRSRIQKPFLNLLFFHHFFFPAQLVGVFTFSDLQDKRWSQVSSLLAPGTCIQFLSRIGFRIPTASRFSSNVVRSRSRAFRYSFCYARKKSLWVCALGENWTQKSLRVCALGENWTHEIDFSRQEDTLPGHRGRRHPDLNPIAEIKSISIPTLISSQFRCPDTKTEVIWLQTLKKVVFNRFTKTRSIPIAAPKSSQVRSPTLKWSQFRPHTANPRQSTFTLKENHFRPAQKKSQSRSPHQNQINFDPYIKTNR